MVLYYKTMVNKKWYPSLNLVSMLSVLALQNQDSVWILESLKNLMTIDSMLMTCQP